MTSGEAANDFRGKPELTVITKMSQNQLKESLISAIADARRTLGSTQFVTDMLILLRFAMQMVNLPEKTFTADQDMLNMSSEVTTLLFELGGEQNEMGQISLIPFHTRKETAMALIAASATFPDLCQRCEALTAEYTATDTRTESIQRDTSSEFQEARQATTTSGLHHRQLVSQVETDGGRRAVTSSNGFHGADQSIITAGSAVQPTSPVGVTGQPEQRMEDIDTARYAAGSHFSVEGAGYVEHGNNPTVEANQSGRRLVNSSDGFYGADKISPITSPVYVMSQPEQRLQDTARDAAGPCFEAEGVRYVAQGNNARIVHNEIISIVTDKLRRQEPLEGRYKLVIMQNFAFHLFFLTTRMPFSVLGAQCNELKKDYHACDLMGLCDMVIRYVEGAGAALGLWRDVDSHVQGPTYVSEKIYRKYMSIKKLVQRSVEAVRFTHRMPEGGAQQYCLIWQQKDELAQDLRIHLQSGSIEQYVFFLFELHWRLAYLNAKWSFALPLRMRRSANEAEHRIEQQEAGDFLKMTRRVPQIFTDDYIAALQGARYQFNLLHNGHHLDATQFTVQLSYIRWLSDNMKLNLNIPDNDRVGFVDLHVPQSPLNKETVDQLRQFGMHSPEEIQAENVPADVMCGTDASLSTQLDSELEMALEISRADQGQQTVTPAEDEELQLALAMSASLADSHESSDQNDTSSSDGQLVRSMPGQGGAESLLRSDQAIGVTSTSSYGRSMDSGVGSINPIIPSSERITTSYTDQNQSTPLAKWSSSVVTDSLSQPEGSEQASVERHRRDSQPLDQSHYSHQSATLDRDRLLSGLLVLKQQCNDNPELGDDMKDLLEAVTKIGSRSTRKLADLERSLLATLVVKYGDEQLLANSLAEIVRRRNMNHNDLIRLCQALNISTLDKTDEELRTIILTRESIQQDSQ